MGVWLREDDGETVCMTRQYYGSVCGVRPSLGGKAIGETILLKDASVRSRLDVNMRCIIVYCTLGWEKSNGTFSDENILVRDS